MDLFNRHYSSRSGPIFKSLILDQLSSSVNNPFWAIYKNNKTWDFIIFHNEIAGKMQLVMKGDQAVEVPINGQMVNPGYPRDSHFCTVFISLLCPAMCSALCISIFSLPYLVIPAVKGGGTEFCNGYWKNQTNDELGGMVRFSIFFFGSLFQ
jgi:hypothetical protein